MSIGNLIVQLVNWYTGSEVPHHAHFYDAAHKRKRREAQIEAFVVKNLGSVGNGEEMGKADVEIGCISLKQKQEDCRFVPFHARTKTCPFTFFEKCRTACIRAPLVAGA